MALCIVAFSSYAFEILLVGESRITFKSRLRWSKLPRSDRLALDSLHAVVAFPADDATPIGSHGRNEAHGAEPAPRADVPILQPGG
jgi:hypothetical protein